MPDVFVADKKIKDSIPKLRPVLNKQQDKNIELPHSPRIHNQDRRSVHLFASYCENPNDVSFKNQGEDEQVLLFVRKHFITNFKWIVIGAILTLPPFLIGPFGLIFNASLLSFLSEKLIFFLTLFYYLLVATYIFVRFITWYYNVSLVTNHRIIYIDFSDIIYKNMASTKISLVQDVSYSQTGVFRTFFHYGDVLVQTAGETPQFDFDAVPNPEDVVHLIGSLIGKHGNL